MKASDVMVANVITVGPQATVQDVAKILLENRISGVPVVDNGGKMVGIISEGDLIRRAETGTERHRSRWIEIFIGKHALANEYVKSHALAVKDVMTRNVVTARPETHLGEIASTMEKHGIKRVPIVKDGKLVGIVSRANLLQALASLGKKMDQSAKVEDQSIRNQLITRLDAEPWNTSLVNVIVSDGTVELWGFVDSAEEMTAIRVMAEVLPGVHHVNDHLKVQKIPSYM